MSRAICGKPRHSRRRIHEREQTVVHHETTRTRKEERQAGRVDEPHMLAVHDDAPRTRANIRIQLIAQRGYRRDIDIARGRQDRYVVPFTHMLMVPAGRAF